MTLSYRELLETELKRFGISLPVEKIRLLARYCEELSRWNEKINLTGLGGEALVRRLIVEPIWIGRELEMSGSLVDVGSGNGSPAVPMHITCSLRRTHLVESRGKRASFLRHIATVLALQRIEVHRGRMEDIAADLSKPDWITLQAVRLTRELIDVLKDLCRPTTNVVWITAGREEAVLAAFRTVSVPLTGTRVFLYRLDLP